MTTMTRFFRPSEEGGGRGGKIRVEGGKDFLLGTPSRAKSRQQCLLRHTRLNIVDNLSTCTGQFVLNFRSDENVYPLGRQHFFQRSSK